MRNIWCVTSSALFNVLTLESLSLCKWLSFSCLAPIHLLTLVLTTISLMVAFPTLGSQATGEESPCLDWEIQCLLFTITKTWKQPNCPLPDEWMRKMWYIYTTEYYSAIKKVWNNAATWMDLEIVILSEVSLKEKDKYHMMSLTCGIYYMTHMNLSTKQKQTHRHREQTCGCQGGRGWGRDGLDIWG